MDETGSSDEPLSHSASTYQYLSSGMLMRLDYAETDVIRALPLSTTLIFRDPPGTTALQRLQCLIASRQRRKIIRRRFDRMKHGSSRSRRFLRFKLEIHRPIALSVL
jgi:hypothetical protein